MTTVKQVAKLAGVNVSTVSRYLSGKLSVTPKTEQRILDAIKATNYRPNIIAQSLRSGTSKTIAVITPDIYQPGISGIIQGIDDRIRDSGFTLLTVMTQGSSARELDALGTVRNMMVSGAIIIGHPIGEMNSTDDIRAAIGPNLPMIFVSRNFKASNVPEICPDQIGGVKQITEHLLEKGYRSIGLIVGSKEHPDAIIKFEGYKRGLASKGIQTRNELITEGFYRPEETRTATDHLLKQNVEAIICASDLMAISAIQHLQKSGLSIPEDIAIAGYGGTIWADIISPRLTTVTVQVDKLGRDAAGILLNHIEGTPSPSNLLIRPVKIRVGETT